MPDMLLRAVVFDFDGVIVDSEPMHLAAFQQILAREGHTLSRDDYYDRYLGFDDRGTFRQIAKDTGFVLDEATVDRWIRDKSSIVLHEMGTNPRVLPGAVDCVAALAASGVALAVASGALRAEVRAGLEAIGLLPYFRAIVGADDTTHSKPSPEPYAAALRALGVEPHGAVSIEDSPAGIASARAAGLLDGRGDQHLSRRGSRVSRCRRRVAHRADARALGRVYRAAGPAASVRSVGFRCPAGGTRGTSVPMRYPTVARPLRAERGTPEQLVPLECRHGRAWP